MAASMRIRTNLGKLGITRLLEGDITILKRHIKNKLNLNTLSTLTVPSGGKESLKFEVGKLARFADGSVVVTCGDTSVLVAVTGRTEPTPGATFLPLTVDYRQKAAAAGRIPTNHLRREMGASDREILTGRVIDRSLRPKFPDSYYNETQVTCNVMSLDGVNDPDVISINGASAALAASVIPWQGPVGAVRVGFSSDNKIIINPNRRQQLAGKGSVIVTTDQKENILMLEGEMKMVDYGLFIEGVTQGASSATSVAQALADITNTFKRPFTATNTMPSQNVIDSIEKVHEDKVFSVLADTSHDKISRDTALKKARYSTIKDCSDLVENQQMIHDALNVVEKKLIRKQILSSSVRCDGRLLEDVRTISSSVDVFRPLHGSALFQRGQTQVMCTLTFDSLQTALRSDPMSVLTGGIKEKNFMLHYEFPAYATNEIKNPGMKNRREIGHGALAEKGLRAIIPDNLPFSIRLTSEVLESNGSSSMASICAGSLALMDAGVHILEPAAGIAMGLVSEISHKRKVYKLLTDIMGLEDYFGDMDLKVGGTKTGLTAIQMDLKIPGIPVSVLRQAIIQSQAGLAHVLDRMQETSGLSQPRPSFKPNGPVRELVTVLPAKRAGFLGVGGHNMKKLQHDVGVTITPVDESQYEVFAPNSEAMQEAMEIINKNLESKKEPELEFNAIYESKIVEIRENGVMVQIHPAMDPVFVPNRQLDHRQVQHASALGLQVGQMISVKYFGRDPVSGHHRVSRKVLSALSSKTFQYMDNGTSRKKKKV
ncbi:polyribonucleotide nucleotidyltransferase 1, mitochondrial-like [Mya arenaria]|uniref:polyribonucleotide nucleotidyltransferase 1, mitochondrial-like n=1 Tax=Mya arenaria TaxID=6604 RepID=UPI0022E5584F|nr:polyribonucleotide nucleotidyltransferase 1, mitochondrial-like [Mya arenaria]